MGRALEERRGEKRRATLKEKRGEEGRGAGRGEEMIWDRRGEARRGEARRGEARRDEEEISSAHIACQVAGVVSTEVSLMCMHMCIVVAGVASTEVSTVSNSSVGT